MDFFPHANLDKLAKEDVASYHSSTKRKGKSDIRCMQNIKNDLHKFVETPLHGPQLHITGQ